MDDPVTYYYEEEVATHKNGSQIHINREEQIISVQQGKMSWNQLYSYLQDMFDEPQWWDTPVPIIAHNPWEYEMINGWRLDQHTRDMLNQIPPYPRPPQLTKEQWDRYGFAQNAAQVYSGSPK